MEDAILINIKENYPIQFLDELLNELKKENVKVEKKYRGAVIAGIEWMLPTAVVVYFLKPFFEAFLKEAGKDTYDYTKSQLKKFIIKNREIKTRYIAAAQSPDKLSKSYDQSSTISIKAKIHPTLLVTVLISEVVVDAEADQMLEAMFQVLTLLYEECQKQDNNTEKVNQGYNEVFLVVCYGDVDHLIPGQTDQAIS